MLRERYFLMAPKTKAAPKKAEIERSSIEIFVVIDHAGIRREIVEVSPDGELELTDHQIRSLMLQLRAKGNEAEADRQVALVFECIKQARDLARERGPRTTMMMTKKRITTIPIDPPPPSHAQAPGCRAGARPPFQRTERWTAIYKACC